MIKGKGPEHGNVFRPFQLLREGLQGDPTLYIDNGADGGVKKRGSFKIDGIHTVNMILCLF